MLHHCSGLSKWLCRKESACQTDMSSIPGSGRSPGGGNGNPLQYSCPENSMNRGAWGAPVHRFAKESDTTYQVSTHAPMITLGEKRDLILQACHHNIFINQSAHNFVFCVFLMKGMLLEIHCWFTNVELTANSTVMHIVVTLLSDVYFLAWGDITAFLCLATLDKNSSL